LLRACEVRRRGSPLGETLQGCPDLTDGVVEAVLGTGEVDDERREAGATDDPHAHGGSRERGDRASKPAVRAIETFGQQIQHRRAVGVWLAHRDADERGRRCPGKAQGHVARGHRRVGCRGERRAEAAGVDAAKHPSVGSAHGGIGLRLVDVGKDREADGSVGEGGPSLGSDLGACAGDGFLRAVRREPGGV